MRSQSRVSKVIYRSGAALQALALLGAGVAVLGVSAAPAAAQDFTNVTATGRVQDTTGAAIAGAQVTVTSSAQGFSRTTTTNDAGSFEVPSLPAGVYTFTITAPGFNTLTETGVRLDRANSANQFTIARTGAVASNAIVVTGRRQIVDFGETTTGDVINIGEIADTVPVARDLTSVIQLAPGTTAGDSAFGNLASIGGASVAENAFFVNGLNVTNFRTFLAPATVPFEFYETVEVKNGGFQAEFGRATGGFVNAITKSGSNEYHVGALVTYEPPSFSEEAPNTFTADNELDRSERIDTNFYASGPIIKDRLFVYGLYNFRYNQDVFASNTSGIYTIRDDNSPFYAFKVDAIPLDGHRFELTYFDTSATITDRDYNYDPETNEVFDLANTTVFRLGGENYVGRYTGNFTDWLTLSAAYGKSKDRDNTGTTNDSLSGALDNRTDSRFGNPTVVIEENLDTREFYRADVDLFFDLFGSHHIRGGYDRENLTSDVSTSYTGGVFYQYFTAGADDSFAPEGTDYVAGRTFINGGVFEVTNEAFYIQDQWTLFNDRLTLNLGIRNDRFTNKNANGEVFYESGDQWGPRLGATFDVFGDGGTKAYGFFGRYFLPIAANTNQRLAGAELDYTRYFELDGLQSNGLPIIGDPLVGFAGAAPCPDSGVRNCRINSDGEVTPTIATISQSLQPQYADEYILGLEQRLGERLTVELYGTYETLGRALEDVAIDAAVLDYCDAEGISGCDDIYTGFHQYVLVNPGVDSTITLNETLPGDPAGTLRTVDFTADQLGYPEAEREYKALTLKVNREFDGVWGLSGSYTLSETEGNYEGAVKSDIGQADPGITQDFDQPGLVDGTYGLLPTHRAHVFKAYGNYALTDWFTLGANYSLTSPRKYGCIGRVPAEVDFFAQFYGAAGYYCHVDGDGTVITDPDAPNLGQRQLTPRGSVFESDWSSRLNLSAVFTLPTDEFNGFFRVDAFNVFNEQAVIDLNEFGTDDAGNPNPQYMDPVTYQTPRYFRFQIGIRY